MVVILLGCPRFYDRLFVADLTTCKAHEHDRMIQWAAAHLFEVRPIINADADYFVRIRDCGQVVDRRNVDGFPVCVHGQIGQCVGCQNGAQIRILRAKFSAGFSNDVAINDAVRSTSINFEAGNFHVSNLRPLIRLQCYWKYVEQETMQ